MKFKVGDRVKHKLHGKGIIKYIDSDKTYAVEFDKNIDGIMCRGYCKKNHGQWCDDDELEIDVFTKSDLQNGDIVTYRNGKKRTILNDNIIEKDGYIANYLHSYNEDLTKKDKNFKELDIVKVDRLVKYETVFERKEEILDEAEKRYLSNVIRPFREEVCSIKKMKSAEQYRIKITTRNGNIILPHFQKNKMYVNMQEEKEYKLEELGL